MAQLTYEELLSAAAASEKRDDMESTLHFLKKAKLKKECVGFEEMHLNTWLERLQNPKPEEPTDG